MKIVIAALLVLVTGIASASDKIYFLDIPKGISNQQAIKTIQKAAIRRKWTVSVLDKDKLQINLTHHGYKALLIFSAVNGGVYYKDLTTEEELDEYSDGETYLRVPAPRSWVKNIKKDTERLFATVERNTEVEVKYSPEELEKKLESLKRIYDKKLITEAEYTEKKKELMSRF